MCIYIYDMIWSSPTIYSFTLKYTYVQVMSQMTCRYTYRLSFDVTLYLDDNIVRAALRRETCNVYIYINMYMYIWTYFIYDIVIWNRLKTKKNALEKVRARFWISGIYLRRKRIFYCSNRFIYLFVRSFVRWFEKKRKKTIVNDLERYSHRWKINRTIKCMKMESRINFYCIQMKNFSKEFILKSK